MPVIDFRFRPHTREILQGLAIAFKDVLLADCTLEDYLKQAQSIETIAAELVDNDMKCAVIVGRDIETTFGAMPNNKEVTDFCQKYPSLFKGFAGADPHKGKLALADLKHWIKDEDFAGVAVDPLHAKLCADDAAFSPIYEKCCEWDVPVIITAGPARFVPGTVLEHAHPRHIDAIARDFPELKIVVSHGAWPFVNEMIAVCWRQRNVYMELSEYELFPGSQAYVEAGNTIIGDKILFASAHPGVPYQEAIALYKQLPWKGDVLEKVLWKNAAQLLKIK